MIKMAFRGDDLEEKMSSILMWYSPFYLIAHSQGNVHLKAFLLLKILLIF